MLANDLFVDARGTIEEFVRVPVASPNGAVTKFKRKNRLAGNRKSEFTLKSSFDGSGNKAQGHYLISKLFGVELSDGTFRDIAINLAIHWPEAPLAAGQDLGALVESAVGQIVSILRTPPETADTPTGMVGYGSISADRISSILNGEI